MDRYQYARELVEGSQLWERKVGRCTVDRVITDGKTSGLVNLRISNTINGTSIAMSRLSRSQNEDDIDAEARLLEVEYLAAVNGMIDAQRGR